MFVRALSGAKLIAMKTIEDHGARRCLVNTLVFLGQVIAESHIYDHNQ